MENATSHIDISGEPQVKYDLTLLNLVLHSKICFFVQFLERMQLDYNAAAHDKKCYVVGSCGFDSIPADMGTVFLEEKLGGQVNSVETYLNIRSKKVCFYSSQPEALADDDLIFSFF